jgi:hypothetical protein
MSQFTGLLSATGLGSIRNLGVVAAGDVTPNAVDWGNVQYTTGAFSLTSNNSAQITGIDTTIYITTNWTYNSGGNISLYYKIGATAAGVNEFPGGGGSPGWNALNSSGIQIAIENNQYLSYSYLGEYADQITVTVKNASDSDTTLDTFQCIWSESGCILTTAVVSHMGLADDGAELTAMRSLREHYKNISGYQEIIDEYYQNSPLIIDAINQANAQETEYQYIYSTVVGVMNHVNNQEWQQAHDLYMAMYNNLKNTYLGM